MTPRLSALRLSIVDFLGVFLPGAIWSVLILTAIRLLGWKSNGDATPLEVTSALLGTSPGSDGKIDLSGAFYAGFILFSVLMGYLVKSFSSRPAEWVAFWIHWLISPKLRMRCRDPENRRGDFRFPYHALFKAEPYFPSILRIVQERTGQQAWEHLPGYQPFETCKTLLRVCAPGLWEEAQRREAQSRFIVSLTLAALFSTILALVAVVLAWKEGQELAHPVEWLTASTIISFLLSSLVWKSRRGEVGDVYMFTLIASQTTGLSQAPLVDESERFLDD